MIAIRPWAWKVAALLVSWAVAFYVGKELKQGQWDRAVAREASIRNSALVKGMANSYGTGLRFESFKADTYERYNEVEKQVGLIVDSSPVTDSDLEWRRLLNAAARGALPTTELNGGSAK